MRCKKKKNPRTCRTGFWTKRQAEARKVASKLIISKGQKSHEKFAIRGRRQSKTLYTSKMFGKNIACNNVKNSVFNLANCWIWLKMFSGRILKVPTGFF